MVWRAAPYPFRCLNLVSRRAPPETLTSLGFFPTSASSAAAMFAGVRWGQGSRRERRREGGKEVRNDTQEGKEREK